MNHTCENCAKAHWSPNYVDFQGGPDGYEFDCDDLEKMTDEDCEACEMGKCPYFIPQEEDE